MDLRVRPDLWPLLLAAACSGASGDSDAPTPAIDTPCGAPLCISTDPDAFVEGRLVATTALSSCFWGTGFAPQPPPRVLIDGVPVFVGGGDGATCVSHADLPPHTPSGVLEVEQGTDLDADGEEDPASAVRSNGLQIVTSPWITGVQPGEAVSGEEITVGLANVPSAVSWALIPQGCGLDVLSSGPTQAVVTPLWSSRSSWCELVVEAGRVEAGGAPPLPEESWPIEVLPRLDWGCHARPGEACSLVGVGFGTPDGMPDLNTPWGPDALGGITVDGVAVVPGPGDSWTPNEVRFAMPALPGGPHEVVFTTASGREVEGVITTQGWTRHPLQTPAPGFDTDHEGTLVAVRAGVLSPTGALETRDAVFVASVYANGQLIVQGLPHPELPSSPPSPLLVSINDWDPCTRIRATGVPDALNLLGGSPGFLGVARSRGLAATVDWDGLPARPCEPSFRVDVVAQAAGGRWDAWNQELDGSARAVVAGLARFDFGADPPIPDPLGRPGREVPVLAVRDDLAGTTSLFVVNGAPPIPLLPGPLAGRGTLHEAGPILYVAGGEPGFDGVLHEVEWTGSRPIPLPVPGLSADRLPAFTGSPDGRLWAVVVDGGEISVRSWDPPSSSWSVHSIVPPAVSGGDPLVLVGDPAAHDVRDLAVFQGSPVLAVLRPTAAGALLEVVGWDGTAWTRVQEPLTGIRMASELCLAHESDGMAPVPPCPAGTARYATNGWRDQDDTASAARLLATSDGLWVRYRTDDGTSTHAWAASIVGPLFPGSAP